MYSGPFTLDHDTSSPKRKKKHFCFDNNVFVFFIVSNSLSFKLGTHTTKNLIEVFLATFLFRHCYTFWGQPELTPHTMIIYIFKWWFKTLKVLTWGILILSLLLLLNWISQGRQNYTYLNYPQMWIQELFSKIQVQWSVYNKDVTNQRNWRIKLLYIVLTSNQSHYYSLNCTRPHQCLANPFIRNKMLTNQTFLSNSILGATPVT